ncbi:hypothetical protein AGMMS50230_15220 [Spirochaetia bacterium]|nr:hypothetical protein AGMMS50230_15220 [Spirochaetia bacterium]
MKTNDFEDQLSKIRVDLYEQTKNMQASEIVLWEKENARKIAKKYGITISDKKIELPA